MLLFALGYIVLGYTIGLLNAVIIVVMLVYFRRPIERKMIVTEKAIENAGPRPKGFIFNPPSEADDARAQIIADNKKRGRDTYIKDLT